MSNLIHTAIINSEDRVNCPDMFGQMPRQNPKALLSVSAMLSQMQPPMSLDTFIERLDRDGVVHINDCGVFVIFADSESLLQQRIKWLMLDCNDSSISHTLN